MDTNERQISITINGQRRTVPAGRSLTDLLEDLELDARMVVVEHNRIIVRRPDLADTRLDEGDNVELVHFVGGG